MLDAVIRALDQDRNRRDGERAVSRLRIFMILSPGVSARSWRSSSRPDEQANRARLQVTEITVKIHRAMR